ncbi:oligosaccharide repeat unit polymerase [Halobacteriovorax vibrionivorans]|uniref:Oligosaccharide repeat unit polymerase n=1 Tax=Halobacteriovorax vibrionivorans TaxID=2152716 RepID=A0ABY0IGK5_9BACT|nr:MULTISPECIES: O-antigen polymerase [Halobacteriovorax]RZF21649.1 oligosaccharide repeat unit polymerase [Halobacteriovorax vibrionivorans]TGD49059.1 oligosaccharide repeat unit polymerase [Halobacteriovorax sp. Y22]
MNFELIEYHFYLCLIILVIKFFINGWKDHLTYFILFYFFFSMGPILNLILGNGIYFGTPKDYIHIASTNFLCAIATMSILSVLIRPRNTEIEEVRENFPLLNWIFIAFIFLAFFNITKIVTIGLNIDKVTKISLIGNSIHYIYLLLQLFLTSFYYLCRKNKTRRFYYLNFFTYIAYCLVTGERDFIFPLFSIVGHLLIHHRTSFKKKLILTSSLSLLGIGGTLIFLLRDATQKTTNYIESFLNQGSLLFVNAFTAKMVDIKYNFFYGETYLHSFLSLLPSFIYKSSYNNLAWLKDNYAPGGDSGYGFGLDAEGYMNFGYIGVIITFAIIVLIQRYCNYNINRGKFFKYYSVFFHGFTMYCFRNDSLAFFKGNLYAIIVYFIIIQANNFITKGQGKVATHE